MLIILQLYGDSSDSSDIVGGICGAIAGTNSSSATSTSTLSESFNNGKIESNYRAGGIVGTSNCTNILNCYNLSKVESKNEAGGIVAYETGTSYNTLTKRSK